MHKPYSLTLSILFGLAMASTVASADPATQPLQQVTIPPEQGLVPADGRPIKPDALQPVYWYSLPLYHITQKQLFSEMDQAFVLNVDTVVLKPSETVRYSFRIEGLKAVIPGPSDHMLIIRTTPWGFDAFRSLAAYFDVPKRRLGLSLPSGQVKKKVTRQRASLPLTTSENPFYQSSPDTATAPEVGGPEVMEDTHAYRYPLTHTTPLAVLDKLRHAYVPDGGSVVLKSGETLHSSFSLPGVRIIFPNIQNNSLLVYATPNGFESVRQLFKILDVSGTLLPLDVYSHGPMTTVTGTP